MMKKVCKFRDLLEKDNEIPIKDLKRYTFEAGCPDDNSHFRSLTWKILLTYLSENKDEWKDTLKTQRSAYDGFVTDFIVNESSYQNGDHPLSNAATSQWNTYFRDNEVLSQIIKDVRRLYPDISFFQQKLSRRFPSRGDDCDIIGRTITTSAPSVDIIQNAFGAVKLKNSGKKSNPYSFDDDSDLECLAADEEYNWQVVARILFIFAKLNPCQGYIQGMNEIIGPIYYVFAKDSRKEWAVHCEADTFWCFTSLMSEIRDMYNSQLDSDLSTGVVSMMNRLTSLLFREDRELYQHLYVNQGIKPHFHAFRWITLLLSQEFPLPEVLRIWDFLLADQNRFDFLIEMCCAMLMLLHNELMQGDYSSNIKLLQNFPEKIEVETVISKAKSIRTKK